MPEKITVPLTRTQAERVIAAIHADRRPRNGLCTQIGRTDDLSPVIRMTEFQECVRGLFEQLTPHKIEDANGDVTFWFMPEDDAYWLEATLKTVTPSAAAPRS